MRLVSCLGNKCSIADAALDLVGGLGPCEGSGVVVPVSQEAGDGALQVGNAGEAASANHLLESEPAFDQVEPRGTGRSEVQVKTRMFSQPPRDGRMFVGAVVVTDQMDLAAAPAAGERIEKIDELVVPVAPITAPVNLAAGHFERGEQAGGAVAGVVWVICAGMPGLSGRIGAVRSSA
jgi:hypothetical protein